MKITVLVENTTINEKFKAEHGLSLFIEYKDRRILLDAGSSGLFAENAKLLGVDLSRVDYAVLSHGHYDHSGGLGIFFETNPHAVCYACEGMEGAYYSSKGGMHYIGVPEEVLQKKDRFRLVHGTVCIEEGVYLVPHDTAGLAEIGERSGLYKKENEAYIPDDFSHEQSLVFGTPKGWVIANSCSHGGADVIIDEVKKALGGKIYAYLGGLHMMGRKKGAETCTFTPEQLDELAEKIRSEKLERIYTGHCTGMPGLGELKNRLPGIAEQLSTGKVIEIENENQK